MTNEESNVILNFRMDGQVQYANTIKEINQVMNIAAKEYKAHIAAMGNDASATEKLSAAHQKLEIQLEGAQKRTEILRAEFEKMTKENKVSTEELNKHYGKLVDAERAEASLANQLKATSEKLKEQSSESAKNQAALSKLDSEQKDITASAKELESEYKLQKAQMAETATESEKLAASEKYVGEQMNFAQQKVKSLENQLQLAKKEFGEDSREAKHFGTALNDAKTDVLQFENSLKELNNKSDKTNSLLGGISKAVKLGALSEITNAFDQLGQKIFDFGKASLDAFNELDEGSDIIVTKTGATGDAVNQFKDIYNNMVGSVNADSQTIGSAIGEVNTQFGLHGEALEKTATQMVKYSKITGQDVTDATIQSKQVIDQYNLSVSDLGMVMDVSAKTAQQTGMDVNELNQQMISNSSTIQGLNLSYDQGAKLVGNLSKSGVDVGQTLKSISKASVVYAKDNKTLSQGLGETIDKIKGAKTHQEALVIATEVFGAKAAPKMVKGIKDNTLNLENLGGAAKDASGTVKKTFEGTQDPIDKLKLAGDNFLESMAGIGEAIATTLEPVFKKLGDILKVVSDFFQNLPGPAKDFIVIFGAVIGVLGAVVPPILMVAAAATALDVSLLPVIAIIAAIAAVIAGVVLVIKNWGSITDWLSSKWNDFMNYNAIIWEGLKLAAKLAWESIKEHIITPVSDAWTWLVNKLGDLGSWISEKWNEISRGTKEAWSNVKEHVIQPITDAHNWVVTKLHNFKTSVLDIWNSVKEWVSEHWSSVEKLITDPIGNASDAISGIIDNIIGFFDFDINWPHIPIPQFGISPPGWSIGDLLDGEIPSLNIDWHAAGGIFTEPTLMRSSNGNIHGVGEAGDEGLIPLNPETLGMIGKGIASTMTGGNTVVHVHVETLVADNMASIDRLNRQIQIGATKSKNMLGER
ncbi:hypothetical protein AWI85_05965 [Listeria monocytogenes]|uniref:hypothetical protein n=1 Tax=Listeria monocytogenes TaxID=1639 RepID=UPI000775A79D|nr:hypothetical protein [Listeria monocytogenes]KXS79258.1 hypothetical protein AWI86_05255 [Listeria monocytogenes]KXS81546.1 hypothetical protein AWI85_05965 [Listeria monocytogenes]KXX12490.1 hypothetical protein AWI84_06185 [Listeria monocytogenes]KXX18708.1 hypothetical protein AWI83_06185 [Listeria monocytogenes]KXX21386.1 hypothetical protein AWI82_06185 [Listeria monocytogenes]